jgi:uncharacterized OB-fold protein
MNFNFSKYGPKKHAVSAYTCPGCGKLYYPAVMICDQCHTRRDPSNHFFADWDKIPLEGECTLLTWTRVYALPEGFMKKYLDFGIVEFPNGLRASGQLSVDEPKIGMKLTSSIGIVKERVGKDHYGFIFVSP